MVVKYKLYELERNVGVPMKLIIEIKNQKLKASSLLSLDKQE
jgi:hypothetical protein